MSVTVPEPGYDQAEVRISADLTIPASELTFRFSRSGGPGGQHANRSETRVELTFDVAHSPSLSEEQRDRLTRRLSGYIDGEGTLHLFSALTRSQLANRADVVARFQALLNAALKTRKRRLPTQPTAAGRERRLRAKRARSGIKQMRRQDTGDFE